MYLYLTAGQDWTADASKAKVFTSANQAEETLGTLKTDPLDGHIDVAQIGRSYLVRKTLKPLTKEQRKALADLPGWQEFLDRTDLA